MNTPTTEVESLLSIEIGTIHTRALLFDLVDGQYRFLGASRVASTHNAPFYDISEGVFQALNTLQDMTARYFLENSRLILPGREDGAGIDALVMTYTAGPGLRIAVLGLLEDVSLESARRLASSTQSVLVEAIGLNDHRKHEAQVDALLKAKPNLIVIAGGTEKGATRSVAKVADLVSLMLQLTPKDRYPEIMYVGNQAMQKHISEALNRFGDVKVAPNVRPSIENELLAPAQEMLAQTVTRIRNRHLGGLQAYSSITSAPPAPSSHTFGRLVRYLSQINDNQKHVLGVDLGASYTTLAAAREGKLELSVYTAGVGAGLERVLELSKLEEITRWLSIDIPDDLVRDYLHQKILFPGSIPATVETLAIEQAVTRQILNLALKTHRARYRNPLSAFEPVLISGTTLTQATPGAALLMLLDGLQPVGTTTFVLDPYGLATALGAAAAVNTLIPVQVVETNALINLGTVISPLSNARYGTSIINIRIEYESGEEAEHEIRQGNIYMLPVQPGQTARIHLEPLRALEIDPLQKSANRSFKVIGGVCGTVIDARGRPLELPKDDTRRQDLLKKWATSVGA
jgi:hypothetical protein